nr:hypothetical protein [Providencia alcalifaciens]
MDMLEMALCKLTHHRIWILEKSGAQTMLDKQFLQRTIALAVDNVAEGRRPFGAIIVEDETQSALYRTRWQRHHSWK